ncbi:WD40/YVTN/BNR-like repeat-containing protein [Carnobacterium gallinarum]|uniref:WD40/YVTN/BNR-like repeat-containing protein n=1 Tax=Carnobacterium gallinarum TaxID=2749 RepID=UPI000558ED37|nr:hypothetical protein [Carnobacterium gallinarum]
MNAELFIIELLSAKKQIIQHYKKGYKQLLLLLSFTFLITTIFFFGIATLTFRHFQFLNGRVSYFYRLNNLYHFSIFIGAFISLICIILFLTILIKSFLISTNFTNWLDKHVIKIMDLTPLWQDTDYYYVSSAKSSKKQKNIPIKKKSCHLLTMTLDGKKIMIGQTPFIVGTFLTRIFILDNDPIPLPNDTKKRGSWTKNSLILTSICLCIGIISAYYYGTHTITINEWDNATKTQGQTPNKFNPNEMNTTKPNTTESGDLTVQIVQAPINKISAVNNLYFDKKTNELYMTTDSGTNWQFIPIKAGWLRGGDYTLTTGEVSLGYWMDKTYEVSRNFSWFLYSPDNKAVYLLSSTDNGKNWQKSSIDDNLGKIRYRKALFFANGAGVAIFSTPGPDGMSSENITFYTTANYGEIWSKSNSTSISQPIQNASFLSQSLGFIATRTTLYYTNNYGRTFSQSLINVPDDYSTEGLDIFQSPYEVTATSTSTLEAKFNLVKTKNIDIGKMFACLFRSVDGGETWTFVQPISQIEHTN